MNVADGLTDRIVVPTCQCPSICWIATRSTPRSSLRVAQASHSPCGLNLTRSPDAISSTVASRSRSRGGPAGCGWCRGGSGRRPRRRTTPALSPSGGRTSSRCQRRIRFRPSSIGTHRAAARTSSRPYRTGQGSCRTVPGRSGHRPDPTRRPPRPAAPPNTAPEQGVVPTRRAVLAGGRDPLLAEVEELLQPFRTRRRFRPGRVDTDVPRRVELVQTLRQARRPPGPHAHG